MEDDNPLSNLDVTFLNNLVIECNDQYSDYHVTKKKTKERSGFQENALNTCMEFPITDETERYGKGKSKKKLNESKSTSHFSIKFHNPIECDENQSKVEKDYQELKENTSNPIEFDNGEVDAHYVKKKKKKKYPEFYENDLNSGTEIHQIIDVTEHTKKESKKKHKESKRTSKFGTKFCDPIEYDDQEINECAQKGYQELKEYIWDNIELDNDEVDAHHVKKKKNQEFNENHLNSGMEIHQIIDGTRLIKNENERKHKESKRTSKFGTNFHDSIVYDDHQLKVEKEYQELKENTWNHIEFNNGEVDEHHVKKKKKKKHKEFNENDLKSCMELHDIIDMTGYNKEKNKTKHEESKSTSNFGTKFHDPIEYDYNNNKCADQDYQELKKNSWDYVEMDNEEVGTHIKKKKKKNKYQEFFENDLKHKESKRTSNFGTEFPDSIIYDDHLTKNFKQVENEYKELKENTWNHIEFDNGEVDECHVKKKKKKKHKEFNENDLNSCMKLHDITYVPGDSKEDSKKKHKESKYTLNFGTKFHGPIEYDDHEIEKCTQKDHQQLKENSWDYVELDNDEVDTYHVKKKKKKNKHQEVIENDLNSAEEYVKKIKYFGFNQNAVNSDMKFQTIFGNDKHHRKRKNEKEHQELKESALYIYNRYDDPEVYDKLSMKKKKHHKFNDNDLNLDIEFHNPDNDQEHCTEKGKKKQFKFKENALNIDDKYSTCDKSVKHYSQIKTHQKFNDISLNSGTKFCNSQKEDEHQIEKSRLQEYDKSALNSNIVLNYPVEYEEHQNKRCNESINIITLCSDDENIMEQQSNVKGGNCNKDKILKENIVHSKNAGVAFESQSEQKKYDCEQPVQISTSNSNLDFVDGKKKQCTKYNKNEKHYQECKESTSHLNVKLHNTESGLKQIDKKCENDKELHKYSEERNRLKSSKSLISKITVNDIESDVNTEKTKKEKYSKNCQYQLSADDESICIQDMQRKVNRRKPLKMNLPFITVDENNLDCDEDPLPFALPFLHKHESIQSFTMEQKQELKGNNIEIATHQWTKKENAILVRNYTNFVKEYNVNDPSFLFGLRRKMKSRSRRAFLKAKHFYARLGQDLNNRSLFTIYMCARIIFDPKRQNHTFSEEEVSEMLDLSNTGRKWRAISEMINRSNEQCYSAYKWHKLPINKGPWSAEEVEKLKDAIRTVSNSMDMSASAVLKISWEEVSKLVKVRNSSQCRLYWGHHLAWSENSARHKWTKIHSKNLVELLSTKYYVKDEALIPWTTVQNHFDDASPSYMFLSKRWNVLKQRLKNYSSMGLKDILNRLKAQLF